MMRKFFFGSFLMAAVLGLSSIGAFAQDTAQQKPDPNNPCGELTAEQVKQLTPENKKKYDEELAKCKQSLAEYNAKKSKIENADKIIQASLKEGNQALNAAGTARASKNYQESIGLYDTAVTKYDAGYNADTEYWESAPLFLIYKAAALRGRGVAKYTFGRQNKDSTMIEAAKKDLNDSVDALNKALDFYAKATAPTEAASAQKFQSTKTAAISDRAESYRVLLQVDAVRAEEGVKAFQDYLAVETDLAKKQKAQENLAFALFSAGNLDMAAAEYQKIIATQPDNPDALYFLGTALVASGEEAKIKEGVTHLEKLVKIAPATYDQQKVADAKGLIEVNTAKPASTKTNTGKRKN